MYKAKGVERVPITFNNEKYFYEKCNRVIKNVIRDRNANVTRAQPVIGERIIRGDYERNGLDRKRNKRLGKNPANRRAVHLSDSEDSYEESGPVNKNLSNVTRAQPVKRERFIGERNGPDDKRNTRLKKNHANRRAVHLSDSEDSYEESGPVNKNRFNHVTEGQKGKCNKLQEKKNISAKIEEKNSDTDDDTSTEVEILDSDEIIKKGTTSAFVPSTIYRSDFGVSEASSDYRERVLNVLKKPFDKEEYRQLSEDVKLYAAKYPSLKMKLNEFRYKRLTRITILRGFFYWLQNVMHDEAFQPWEDSQCLAVEPRSGLGEE